MGQTIFLIPKNVIYYFQKAEVQNTLPNTYTVSSMLLQKDVIR
jgi:hypothetical protein